MDISSLFHSTPVAKLPFYTTSGIIHSAEKLINELKVILSEFRVLYLSM